MRKGQPLNQLTEEKRYFLYFWILRLPFCHQSTLMLMSLKGMSNFVKDGLGKTTKVGKGIMFYKIMPENVNKTDLEAYKVDIYAYTSQFWKAPVDEKKERTPENISRITYQNH